MDVRKHVLVPPHELMSEAGVEELLAKYGITKRELPKILISDPAIKDLGAKSGDVVKIRRNSPVSGISYYYRVVIEE
jgi:DNA-directed RNA polymerase subunit H